MTIKIFQLPVAGAVDDLDLLHISQGSIDYKITIADLASKFGEVDIFGLLENVDPLNGYFFPVATTTDVSGNQKISLQNLMLYTQEKQHFADVGVLQNSDKVVIRNFGSDTQVEVDADDFRAKMLAFTELPTLASLSESDQVALYDVSAAETIKLSLANFRQNIFNVAALNSYIGNDNSASTRTTTY